MKKLFLITLMSIMITSCEVQSDTAQPSVIGYEFSDEGERMNILAGDTAMTKIWLEYVQAHNEKDLAKISELNAPDIKIYQSNGVVTSGNTSHKQLLSTWFESSSPSWKVEWMVASTVTQNDGKFKYWLTTGNEITDVVDGEKTLIHSVLDVNIVDGKIKQLNIYNRAKKTK